MTLLLSALFGCGKFAGAPVTKTLDIENTYTEIHICDAIEVIMTNTSDEARITAGENIISDVIVYENGDKLEIRLRDGIHYINSNVRILLPYNTELIKATLEDASYIESLINADDFVLNLSDASDLHYTGNADLILTGGMPSYSSHIINDVL